MAPVRTGPISKRSQRLARPADPTESRSAVSARRPPGPIGRRAPAWCHDRRAAGACRAGGSRAEPSARAPDGQPSPPPAQVCVSAWNARVRRRDVRQIREHRRRLRHPSRGALARPHHGVVHDLIRQIPVADRRQRANARQQGERYLDRTSSRKSDWPWTAPGRITTIDQCRQAPSPRSCCPWRAASTNAGRTA